MFYPRKISVIYKLEFTVYFRMLNERDIEVKREVYICLIYYEKAFDTVKHKEMLRMVSRLEVDERDIRLVRNLYYQQRGR